MLAELNTYPHALGPEKAVLSAMLQDPHHAIARAIEAKLSPEHFYLPAHALLYGILLESFERGEEVELVSLVQRLLDKNLLESVGGAAALTELMSYAPGVAQMETHMSFVRDKHTLRSIIIAANRSAAAAWENPEDVNACLDTAEAAMLAIREGAETNKEITLAASVREVIGHFEKLLTNKHDTSGIPTGYATLDAMTNGLKPGEMFVIAARPSMGKTSFMMNIVEHVAVDLHKPTMVFSCEMSSFQLVQRLVFSRARFNLGSVTRGITPNKVQLSNISAAAAAVRGATIFIDDTPGITINELRAKARRKKREADIQLIAIDYLQLMRSRTKQAESSREREIAEISAGLKGLAKELGIPIIVLAQLNRGPESRGGTPRMSDLRESGSIEQDADMVGLLYRSAYYADSAEERADEEGKAELILAKNRNGETGHIPLTFLAHLMRFQTGEPVSTN